MILGQSADCGSGTNPHLTVLHYFQSVSLCSAVDCASGLGDAPFLYLEADSCHADLEFANSDFAPADGGEFYQILG